MLTKCCGRAPCKREEAEARGTLGTVVTAILYCRREKCPNRVAITMSLANDAIAEAMAAVAWEELMVRVPKKSKKGGKATLREALLRKRKK